MPTDEETDLRKQLEAVHGTVYNTTQLREHFTVESFAFGLVVVRRKADNVKGFLEFTHSPRFYYAFTPATKQV